MKSFIFICPKNHLGQYWLRAETTPDFTIFFMILPKHLHSPAKNITFAAVLARDLTGNTTIYPTQSTT